MNAMRPIDRERLMFLCDDHAEAQELLQLVLLRIVLENLLSNAFKFTARRTETRVTFGAEEQNGERVYFVRDNGAGFDPAYANKLFQVFQRLHDRRECPGTGIGLATVQRVIHKLGGRLWAEGAVDRGAACDMLA